MLYRRKQRKPQNVRKVVQDGQGDLEYETMRGNRHADSETPAIQETASDATSNQEEGTEPLFGE